jgi:transcriptional regulator of acetoin/glycerol metabolism
VDLGVPFKDAKHALIEDFEQRYVGTLLARHRWNFSAAAREAGVDRMALHKIVARCGLKPPEG